MATESTQPGQQAAMEDILSSIRTTMAEETAKVGGGSADLIDAAAAQDGPEDDVLELSAADMVSAPTAATPAEELIDIAAFASNGDSKPVDATTAAALAADILGEKDGGDSVVQAADEFDRLLAEISQEQQQNVAAAEVSKQALMDEEDPLGSEGGEEVVEDSVTQSLEDMAVAELTAAAGSTVLETAPVAAVGYSLGAIETPQGVQIAFPAEVLAMALRPMVQDWLAKNLPAVVEKLVKDEISKLTQA